MDNITIQGLVMVGFTIEWINFHCSNNYSIRNIFNQIMFVVMVHLYCDLYICCVKLFS